MDENRAMSQAPYRYEAIALSSESTVVAEFVPEQGVQDAAYQIEAALEHELIVQLQKQAYEYLPITTETDLILTSSPTFRPERMSKQRADSQASLNTMQGATRVSRPRHPVAHRTKQ